MATTMHEYRIYWAEKREEFFVWLGPENDNTINKALIVSTAGDLLTCRSKFLSSMISGISDGAIAILVDPEKEIRGAVSGADILG